MKPIDNIVNELTKSIDDECFNENNFKSKFKLAVDRGISKIIILDFEYYSPARRQHFKNEKIKAVKLLDFESAAEARDKEKLAFAYVELKEQLGLNKSEFYYEDGQLIYLFLGTSRHDKTIKEIVMNWK